MMFRISAAVVAAIVLVLVAAGGARAVDNSAELKCQLSTSLAVGKFIRAKGNCIDNCWKRVFGGDGDPADCVAPFAGRTFGCVTSVEGEAGGALQKGCALDCPECYSGGDCPVEADARIADAEGHVEALAADLFCDDSASPDGLTLREFKCQRTVRKFINKFAAVKLKCFAKCRKAEVGGKLPPGSCTQPTSDLKTQLCIAKLEAKTASAIDRMCESSVNPSADKPECGSYATRTGADWAAAEGAEVDARLPVIFCDD